MCGPSACIHACDSRGLCKPPFLLTFFLCVIFELARAEKFQVPMLMLDLPMANRSRLKPRTS
jgi:hypothetical protein